MILHTFKALTCWFVKKLLFCSEHKHNNVSSQSTSESLSSPCIVKVSSAVLKNSWGMSVSRESSISKSNTSSFQWAKPTVSSDSVSSSEIETFTSLKTWQDLFCHINMLYVNIFQNVNNRKNVFTVFENLLNMFLSKYTIQLRWCEHGKIHLPYGLNVLFI